ncbi:MAG: FAD-dependent oxidoreductase [Alphaproteobacteria bacterium]
MPAYTYPVYPFQRPPELDGDATLHPVLIAGAGPVGLTLALDLAQRGVRSVLLEANETLSDGSRALCWAQRTLEIFDRLGVAKQVVDKGFTWSEGRLFHGAEQVFQFDLQRDRDAQYPAFVNLQQYFAEEYLVDAVHKLPDLIDLRFQNKAVGVTQHGDRVVVRVETPAGAYDIQGQYLAACDGARSTVRRAMGLDFAGRVFEDHFLIADVDTKVPLPATARRFWFLPDFHQGETALCHRQGAGMWRVDFQLGWDGVDPAEEVKPENAVPRIERMLGVPVDVTWLSVYTFQCRRLARLRHGRVLFAGDAAHQVSPFGARGGNSGVQDAENLAWKLAFVLDGQAPEALLESYHDERGFAADENIRTTSRTTDFMTAKTEARRVMREAVLGLAHKHGFARALINSGRLSTATIHSQSPLNGPDAGFDGGVVPGAPCPNLPTPGNDTDFLLQVLGRGLQFDGLYFGGDAPEGLDEPTLNVIVVGKDLHDPSGAIARAFAAKPGSFYLIRPDQHVAARWDHVDVAAIRHAIDIAMARAEPAPARATA